MYVIMHKCLVSRFFALRVKNGDEQENIQVNKLNSVEKVILLLCYKLLAMNQ